MDHPASVQRCAGRELTLKSDHLMSIMRPATIFRNAGLSHMYMMTYGEAYELLISLQKRVSKLELDVSLLNLGTDRARAMPERHTTPTTPPETKQSATQK